jgi:hypothetical protein
MTTSSAFKTLSRMALLTGLLIGIGFFSRYYVAFAADWEYYATRSNGTQHFFDRKSLRVLSHDGHRLAYVTVKTTYTPREHITYLGHQFSGTVTSMSRELIDCDTKLNKTVRVHLFNMQYKTLREWQETEKNIQTIRPGSIGDNLYKAVCPMTQDVMNDKGYF